MNCAQGDLAIVVRNTLDEPCHPIGDIVACAELADTPWGPAWVMAVPRRCPCGVRQFIGLLDADLQPLRGQQQPETVETLEPEVVAFCGERS